METPRPAAWQTKPYHCLDPACARRLSTKEVVASKHRIECRCGASYLMAKGRHRATVSESWPTVFLVRVTRREYEALHRLPWRERLERLGVVDAFEKEGLSAAEELDRWNALLDRLDKKLKQRR